MPRSLLKKLWGLLKMKVNWYGECLLMLTCYYCHSKRGCNQTNLCITAGLEALRTLFSPGFIFSSCSSSLCVICKSVLLHSYHWKGLRFFSPLLLRTAKVTAFPLPGCTVRRHICETAELVHTSPLAASHYEHAGLLQSAFIDLQTVFILHSLPNETRRELHLSF